MIILMTLICVITHKGRFMQTLSITEQNLFCQNVRTKPIDLNLKMLS